MLASVFSRNDVEILKCLNNLWNQVQSSSKLIYIESAHIKFTLSVLYEVRKTEMGFVQKLQWHLSVARWPSCRREIYDDKRTVIAL